MGLYFVEWLREGAIVEEGMIEAGNVANALAVAQLISVEVRTRLVSKPNSFRLVRRDGTRLGVFNIRK